MEIFGKLEINLPFLQALKLPIFSKFIKEFITRKTKPNDKIVIGETVSAVIQKRRMPSKRTDPGMFTLPVSIGNIKVEHAMCDLGASINVLLLSLYKKLEGVRMVDTKVVIQLADRSCISPEGLITKEAKKNPLPQETSSTKKELKTLPLGLRYAYLEENEMFPVIINSNLSGEQETELLEVLRRNKKAIGWTLSDLVRISPDLCMHHIRLEEGAKPHRDPQRKLNPNMREEVLKEVLKLLSLGIIYSILDSKWVSPVHMVPKKLGIQVVTNEKNELVPTKLVTGWRMCIDNLKLSDATRKDHFPLPFIDHMLERLACKKFFYFLDGYNGYFQIYVNQEDQKKTIFTCPFGTYAYRRMPFGLYLLEECIKIFMDDFIVYGNSFETCLTNLDLEGIVMGHIVSEKGIQVDKAKVDVISRLPYPTSQKEIRGFLGHS
ncbi:uncharacterized protein LOC121778759 [Salvia splendens]|uniref:uncharacterized protein LOC121778759 n=1 Tax=Salvia splendens TaxID=180675 RepID=UPI001C265595|nr:uncharacterized protein LOC121778759 [Salvia splendens]